MINSARAKPHKMAGEGSPSAKETASEMRTKIPMRCGAAMVDFRSLFLREMLGCPERKLIGCDEFVGLDARGPNVILGGA